MTEGPRGRLHPLAIVVFARRLLRESLIPLVVLLVAAGPRVLVPLLLVGVPLLGTYLVLSWLRFEYAVEGERLVVRRGVFSRSTRVVPLARIRGVDVREPLLHRALGLVQVEVEAASGGSRKAELSLAAVTPAQAEELRGRVLAAASAADEAEPERVELYRATSRLLLVGGVTSGRYVLAPLAVLGLLANVVDDLPGSLGDRLLGDAVDRVPTDAGGIALLALGLAAAALVLAAAGSLVVDWGFVLADEGERLTAARGLLTRRTVSIDLARVRGVDVWDTPVRRVAGLASVGAIAAGIQGREGGGRSTLAPVVRSSAVEALVHAVDRAAPCPSAPLEPHPRAALPRRFVRALPLPVALTLAAAALGWWWAAAAGTLASALAVPVALDRYRQLGHRWDGRRLAIRGGSLLRRWTTVDPRAVVSYEVRRSPGQARAGLCSVHLHLGQGAGSRRVLDLGEEQARALLAALDAPLLAPLVAAAAA